MTENRLKTYERLLGYILILAIILGVISSLTGCEFKSEDFSGWQRQSQNFRTISEEEYGDIVIDTRTNVEYYMTKSSTSFGNLTLLVDKEGNPLIYKGE